MWGKNRLKVVAIYQKEKNLQYFSGGIKQAYFNHGT